MNYLTKIKKIRLEKKISQEDIAFQLGISQSAYAKIETGKQKLSAEQLIKISKILSIDLKELSDSSS
ncbi:MULTISPECIES: helix-turn-helix domain-containing protein [Capnocytophaga]|uniref:Regulatory protein MunI n=1 Tax=Capnocytophaga canis TaxID=1848903 RepID=A0A0B7IKQ1_9FLAO